MTFGSGANGCLGHGDNIDIVQVSRICYRVSGLCMLQGIWFMYVTGYLVNIYYRVSG